MSERLYMIKQHHLHFLIENVSNENVLYKLRGLLKLGNLDSNKLSISFSSKEISMILDELTLLFTSKGLKKNDEPNDFGLLIEELIDIFAK